jgi:antitoxin (DNA-binding transcriptional repressor) of toxin-antitoxin stability system
MKKINVRSLHLKTSAILNEVGDGQVFVIEKQGHPVAELRPFVSPPKTKRFAANEAFIARLPRTPDSGTILEEDRS